MPRQREWHSTGFGRLRVAMVCLQFDFAGFTMVPEDLSPCVASYQVICGFSTSLEVESLQVACQRLCVIDFAIGRRLCE